MDSLVKAIKKIERKTGLEELPETLQEIANLRKQYPDESLKELEDLGYESNIDINSILNGNLF